MVINAGFAGLTLAQTVKALANIGQKFSILNDNKSLNISALTTRALKNSKNWRQHLMKELLSRRRLIPMPEWKYHDGDATLLRQQVEQQKNIEMFNGLIRGIAFSIGYNSDNLHTSKDAIPATCAGVSAWKGSPLSSLSGSRKTILAQTYAAENPNQAHIYFGGYCTVYLPQTWIAATDAQHPRPKAEIPATIEPRIPLVTPINKTGVILTKPEKILLGELGIVYVHDLVFRSGRRLMHRRPRLYSLLCFELGISRTQPNIRELAGVAQLATHQELFAQTMTNASDIVTSNPGVFQIIDCETLEAPQDLLLLLRKNGFYFVGDLIGNWDIVLRVCAIDEQLLNRLKQAASRITTYPSDAQLPDHLRAALHWLKFEI